MVKHAARDFLIAAESLGVFGSDDILYRDIQPYMSDVTGEITVGCPAELPSMSLAMIRRKYGANPFFLTYQLCFAKQFTAPQLQSVLAFPYKKLYDPIGQWILSVTTEGQHYRGQPDDSCPPLLFSLLEAFIQPTGRTCQPVKETVQQGCQPVKERAMSSTVDRSGQGDGQGDAAPGKSEGRLPAEE